MILQSIFSLLVILLELTQIYTRGELQYEPSDNDFLPDVYMNTTEIVLYYGYPIEEHQVETEDGYLLTMHRIPYGKEKECYTKHPAVFVQHGLIASSSDWVIMGPESGLAYVLADAGFDVWMGNARGNQYSRAHVTLTPDDAEFWQFTWHEMGVYDLPAEIDYILQQTGEESLFYVGHSMGSTLFYVMASTRPEYNQKITAQFSLAPIAYLEHLLSPLRIFAPFADQLERITAIFGINEFLPKASLLGLLGGPMCENGAVTQSMCGNVLFQILGHDSKQLNKTMIPVILGHGPSGTSSRTIIHFIQEIKSGRFRQYDHGEYENMKFYGQETPPDYNLSLVTTPVHLYYARNDLFADIKDVLKLARELPNLQEKYLVPDEEFTHLDFLWAIEVKKLVYDRIISALNSYVR